MPRKTASGKRVVYADDFRPLPKKTISNIIESALPSESQIEVTDEFKSGVNRCTQVWLYTVAVTAARHCQSPHITADMALQVIEGIGFNEFVQPLQEFHQEFVRKAAEKAMNKKTGECQTSDGSADNMDESGGADSEKSNSDHN